MRFALIPESRPSWFLLSLLSFYYCSFFFFALVFAGGPAWIGTHSSIICNHEVWESAVVCPYASSEDFTTIVGCLINISGISRGTQQVGSPDDGVTRRKAALARRHCIKITATCHLNVCRVEGWFMNKMLHIKRTAKSWRSIPEKGESP